MEDVNELDRAILGNSNGLLSEDPRTFAERLQDNAVACLG